MNLALLAFGICSDDCSAVGLQIWGLVALLILLPIISLVFMVLAFKLKEKRLVFAGLAAIPALIFVNLFIL